MNIFLNILESEIYGNKLGQLLATFDRSEALPKGEQIHKTMLSRQYKNISPSVTIIKQLKIHLKTELDIDFRLSDVKIVLHFLN